MSALESPIPLSDIEAVLAWVDTFQLSRPTRKINRDFSDAVLLAEILSMHYPKLVEMHNYPPRNSHSLKLNNWMTLNRKVLKKLKLNLCCSTMEQLATCTPGVIERVLLIVRDKIRRDEEMNKSLKEGEQNVSSGGSYYEACGDDEHVLVVPVKTRVNGVLETIQKKVISHEHYLGLKEELKDAKDSAEMLKQKVEHLDTLIKLKEERIEELQKQLDRKQTRRKDVETSQNSISVPFESEPSAPDVTTLVNVQSRTLSIKSSDGNTRIGKEESKIPVPKPMQADPSKTISKLSVSDVSSLNPQADVTHNIETVKSDVFKEIDIIDQRVLEGFHDSVEYFNEPGTITATDANMNNFNKIEYSYEVNYIN